MTITDQGLLD